MKLDAAEKKSPEALHTRSPRVAVTLWSPRPPFSDVGQTYGSVQVSATSSGDDKIPNPCGNGTVEPGKTESSLRLLWGLIIALCGGVCAEGYDVGVLNGALVRIQDAFGLSTFHIATIVSVTPFCVMPGSLCGGWAADRFGRRPALLCTVVLLIIGPLIMAVASGFVILVIGRGVVGFAIGAGLVIVSMYIAEIAPSDLRGQCITFEEVAFNVGMLLGYGVNWALVGIKEDWRYMLGIGCFLPLPLLITLLCRHLPESPRWLLLHGHQDEAADVLQRYSGMNDASHTIRTWQQNQGDKDVPWSTLFFPAGNIPLQRKLLAGISLGVAQAACGYLPIAYYSSKVMKRAMDEKSAFLNTMIMGLIKTFFVFIAIFLLERVGRRPMLLLSTACCSLGCLFISVAFMNNMNGWVLAAGFWIFMAGFSLGLGPVTFVYLAEIFPTEFRGKAMGIVFFVSRIIATLGTLVFPLLTDGIGVPTTFALLAFINVGLFGLLWGTTIETHGLSLEEVEKVFL